MNIPGHNDQNMPDRAERDECRRCGSCCLKGGPGLHAEDANLVKGGCLTLKDLFTIRRKEPAWDNVRGCLVLAEQDIVKIKSRPGSAACSFFDPRRACTIYASRPLECRILKCWEPESIMAVYQKNRLLRRDLLHDAAGLAELISAHEEVCGYDQIGRLVKEKAWDSLAYRVRYDLAFRDLVVERGAAKAEALEFLFGFPLETTIRRFGISPCDFDPATGQDRRNISVDRRLYNLIYKG
jgi:Fe-S-cluster containining protein